MMRDDKRKKKTVHIRRDMSNNSLIAGIDLGDTASLATLLTPTGDVADRFSFQMDDHGYTLFTEKVPRDARLAFEATSIAYPFYRMLKGRGYDDVTVAHPTELAWIVRSKKKNDRADSLKIAKLHLAGLLPESHLLPQTEQIERDLLIQRVKLGSEIGRMKSRIISYLKREGVYGHLPKSKDNFSARRRAAIASLRFNDDRDLVLKTMVDRLEFMERQCEPLEQRIRKNARENKYVKIIMSIPGIDYYLASLYASYIGDPHRFPSFDHVASVLQPGQAKNEAWQLRPRVNDEEVGSYDSSHDDYGAELQVGERSVDGREDLAARQRC